MTTVWQTDWVRSAPVVVTGAHKPLTVRTGASAAMSVAVGDFCASSPCLSAGADGFDAAAAAVRCSLPTLSPDQQKTDPQGAHHETSPIW